MKHDERRRALLQLIMRTSHGYFEGAVSESEEMFLFAENVTDSLLDNLSEYGLEVKEPE